MKRTNWNNVNKAAKTVKKNVKNMKVTGDLLKDPLERYIMRDYTTKTVVNPDGTKTKTKTSVLVDIRDCKSSTLRRFIKTLDNAYYLVTSEADKKAILNKKIEIETELSFRPDAIAKK